MDEEMMIDLKGEVIAALAKDLVGTDNFDADILEQKVVNAIKEVKRARKYPAYYTDEQIDRDLYDFSMNVYNIALRDYNQIGAEFEKSHNENSVSRSWNDRDKLFAGIVPIARI